MPVYYGTNGSNYINGGSGNDTVHAGAGNDTVYGNGGQDLLKGGADDDTIYYVGNKGAVHGGSGNDYIYAKKTSGAQIHVYGGAGDDTLVMDLARSAFWANRDGHHIFGGRGNDRFIFDETARGNGMLIGRIDEFNNAEDSIWYGNTKLDLYNLPSNIRVVEHLEQQWLVFNNEVAYGLEGARKLSGNDEEMHFPDYEFSLFLLRSLPTVTFIDQVNFVPHQLYEAKEDTLINIDGSGTAVAGMSAAEHIYDGLAFANTINGAGGDDVIDANGGHDTVFGQDGNDMIAGGSDKDFLYGGSGHDTIWGGSERDIISGANGRDVLYGGTSNDTLYGGAHTDTLRGGHANDLLRGGDANDILNGNDDNDTLYGASGNDTLVGGPGQDIAQGGPGADVFRFFVGDLIRWGGLPGSPSQRNLFLDRIEDFVIGQDKIDFSGYHGVSSRSSFSMWETSVGGDDYFVLTVIASDERLLINADDNVTLGQIYDDANFLY